MMTKTELTHFVATAVSAVLVSHALAAQPNVVLIFADDAGYHDFGFQGNAAFEQVTPNIDSIAHDGVVVERAYVTASVCSPSRAGLLTGRYQQRFGFENNLPGLWNTGGSSAWTDGTWETWGLDLDERTLGDRMKDAGYQTALIGKWHQGLADHHHPNARGFDRFFGIVGGSRHFFPYTETYSEAFVYGEYNLTNAIFDQRTPVVEDGYVTDRFGEEAVEFIRSAADDDQPFFLYLSYTAPHTPMHATGEDRAWATEHFPELSGKRLAYIAMMKAMDDSVGDVLEALAAEGVDDETVVVFFNDNGGSIKNASDNTPLRGYKWGPFEGGYRVPMAVRWPGVAKPGGRLAMPVSTLDLTPTLLSAARADQRDTLELDGVDITEWLRAPGDATSDRVLFWRESNREGRVRVALEYPWRLVLSDRDQPRLFRVDKDPSETRNLADEHPSRVREMTASIEAWEAELEEPRWH
ncbi:MAG: sulfatase-like hydrolase/transferase [Planctomycetota bacterium]